MHFGLFAMNMGVCTQPEVAVRVAQRAEAAGFESVWTGEHVVLPDPQVLPALLASHDGGSPNPEQATLASQD